MYTIEKNIPIPKGKGGQSLTNELKKTLDAMEIGDSCLVPNIHVFADAKKNLKPKLFTSRRVDENNFRIFRVA